MRGGCQRWQGAPWFALVPIGLGVFFLPLRDRRHLQGRRRRPVILIALGALLLILALTTRFGEGGLVVPFVLPVLGIVLLPAGSRSRHGAGRASRSRPGPPASTCRCRTAWPPGSGSAAGWRARTSTRADSLAWATSSARPATTWRRIAPTSASRGAWLVHRPLTATIGLFMPPAFSCTSSEGEIAAQTTYGPPPTRVVGDRAENFGRGWRDEATCGRSLERRRSRPGIRDPRAGRPGRGHLPGRLPAGSHVQE